MRRELFITIHKGIRAALFDTASQVARADFATAAEAAAAGEAVTRLVDLLRAHAAPEDAVVFPELARLAPELAADLGLEHARMEGSERELELLAGRLGDASAPERTALGARLHTLLGRLVGDQLRHMDREESEALRVLQAHRTDDELAALEARIHASVPPGAMARVAAILLPAVSLPERATILASARTNLPPPAFAALADLARDVLGPASWAATSRAAGL
jgi:hypothetical protein